SWGLDNWTATYANAGIQRVTANILANFSAGTTTAPAVTFSPASVDFGGQIVGTPSATRGVSLTNSGNAPLSISAIALTGANAADFSQQTTCPLSPATLGAGASCQLTVRFTPASACARSASISVTDDAAGSPQSVPLTGTGTARSATAMPLISRGVPAFASSAIYPASYANDADYATMWTGAVPSWLAYDLSGVAASQRRQTMVGWF